MIKKIALTGLGLALLVSPAFSLAQSTDVQSQIASLLAQLKQLQMLVAQLQAQGGVHGGTTSASCLDLQNNLYLDQTDSMTNGEVTKLQVFLGGRVTGYYGPATLQLVQQWQSSHGLISSGDPDTTGYGYVGPKTRSAMACSGSQPYTPPTNPHPSSPLSATCSGSPYNSGTPGTSWASHVSGGSGSYTYQWTLSNDVIGTGISGDSSDLRQQNLLATYGSTGVKQASVSVSDGTTNTSAVCSVTIAGSSSQPTASLDVTSMSFSTGGKDTAGPLVTGSASNVSQVSVDIKGSGAKTYVVNGRWQAYLNSVYPGTYDVQISDNDSGPNYGMVLARGTLTVSAPSAPKPVITWTSAKAAGNLEVDAGGEVDINGSNLATVDSTQVYIGGLSAPVTWTSDSQVNASVPSTLTIGQYYDLYIVNRNGTSNTVRVHVLGTVASQQTNPVVISSFTASPTYVTPGQPVTFTWNSNLTNNDIQQYGGSCSITGLTPGNQEIHVANFGSSSGSASDYPQGKTTYTLDCTSGGKDGSPSATRQVTVTVSYAAALPQCPANSAQQRAQVGQTIACSCAPGFALGTVQGGGFPGGYYSDNSDICTAGVQSGQINNTSGGEVDYLITPAKSSYPGWTANGVTSQPGTDNWPGSFQITGPKG